MKISSSSSSSTTSVTPQMKYDVFISCRGEDTGNTFASHLDKALRDKQIETFIDNELNRGDDQISPDLLQAIQVSQISVVVFSKGYASSRWCLEGLMEIIQCKKLYGQVVIPIFYEVDPSHVRHQIGSFADAFTKYEQRFEGSLDKVHEWRDALKEAANLSGLDSRVIRPESLLIENLVEDILKRLDDTSSYDNNDLIGIDSMINEIESSLCIGSEDVRGVGIWGVGGIGKTTLASAIFNKISSQFDGSYFIENVRVQSEKSLRQELLSAIFGDNNINISTSTMGPTVIRKRLGRKKVLILFDDVNDFTQIESLISSLACLGLGSRIIITGRDKQVLRMYCEEHQIFEVKELLFPDALKLFCRYAFGQNHPVVGYEELSHKIVVYVGGIPLALKVLGSSLRGQSKTKLVWESTIDRLRKFPDEKIQNVLKISYDGLGYNEQNIFLDIAFFFKGQGIDLVKKFIDASGFYAESGISALIDKSLITIRKDNVIAMHDLLQAMGREIVRQESIDNPGKRSRLCDHEDIVKIFTRNSGTEALQGISLYMSEIKDVHLQPDAFAKMPYLRILRFYWLHYDKRFNKVHCTEDMVTILLELRYFEWCGYPFKSLQSKFHLENLVALKMPYSNIEQLWNGKPQIPNLKEVDLRYCEHLLSCPDFSGATNLESLQLDGCKSLSEIPPSIQCLEKLRVLGLACCSSLEALPDCTRLKSIKKLHLGFCSNLKRLSGLPCNLELLTLHGTGIEELPSFSQSPGKLTGLYISHCSRLKRLPGLQLLEELDLTCCDLTKIPEGLGQLSSLKRLRLGSNEFESIPASIINLTKLEYLDIKHCRRLQFLPEIPWANVEAYNCTSLNTLSPASRTRTITAQASNLIRFSFINCFKLDQNSVEAFVEDTMMKLHSKREDFLYNKRSFNTPRLFIAFPGSEIPNWFDFKGTGSSITMELPLNWFNKKFVGFAMCVVVTCPDAYDALQIEDVGYTGTLHSQDGQQRDHVFEGSLTYIRPSFFFGSDHVLTGMYPYGIGELCYNKVSIHFKVLYRYNIPVNFRVKKCGVRLIYSKYVVEQCGDSSSDEDNEFWEQCGDSSSDEDKECWELMEEAGSVNEDYFSCDEENYVI